MKHTDFVKHKGVIFYIINKLIWDYRPHLVLRELV